ncbi:MAG TPA: protein phosphatase 2C domain-containing protein [Cellvibrio sp.]|nr:protein phosphatase 2C domain-containing protein [Cellvibrio sp.]
MPLNQRLISNAASHPGLKRSNNEDCLLSSPETGLWLVADGMGGHEAGEVASAIVLDTLAKLAQDQAHFSLTQAIQTAHKDILDSAAAGIGAAGMGSTVVALLSRKKNYQVAWVGDSRAYLWTSTPAGGELSRLTTDHSYVQMLLASGTISAEEVENHPDKHIITQCLGIEELENVSVDLVHRQWQKNQWILLCSDGLTDELNDEAIAAVLAANSNSQEAVNQLLEAALEHGGRDNISLQIIESPVQQNAQSFSSLLPSMPTLGRLITGNKWLLATALLVLALLVFFIA